MAKPLQAVQQRVEQAIGPLQLPARQLVDLLEDCVAVALTLVEDSQHERRRRCRDKVFGNMHVTA